MTFGHNELWRSVVAKVSFLKKAGTIWVRLGDVRSRRRRRRSGGEHSVTSWGECVCMFAQGLLKNPNFSGSHEVQERVAVTSRNLYFIYTQIILILDYKITLSLTPLELGK